MALITCPECKRNVSEKAKACPGCGCPISNINTAFKKGAESVTGFGKEVANEVTVENAKGCLGGVGCLVIVVLMICLVFGYHYILIGGFPFAIGTVCVGIYHLMKRVDPDI